MANAAEDAAVGNQEPPPGGYHHTSSDETDDAFASLDVMNARDFTRPESTLAFLVGRKPVRELESSRRIVCVILVSGLRFRSRRCAVAGKSGLHRPKALVMEPSSSAAAATRHEHSAQGPRKPLIDRIFPSLSDVVIVLFSFLSER